MLSSFFWGEAFFCFGEFVFSLGDVVFFMGVGYEVCGKIFCGLKILRTFEKTKRGWQIYQSSGLTWCLLGGPLKHTGL